MKQVMLSVVVAAVWAGVVAVVRAQDATAVDAKHYTVAFENNQVRVLKAHYEPGEKSVMHSHPDTVAVFLTEVTGKFTFADGTTTNIHRAAGEVSWSDALTHLPENTGSKAFDVIVVELKSKAAK